MELAEARLGVLGLLLGLGVVHVELRLVIVGGLLDVVDGRLDAVRTQTPTVRQGVSGLFAHARSFGLPDDRVTSILQHAVRTLDLAAAETGALALLENLLRSILGAAGDVLQSLLGLGALLGEPVEQVAVLVEDHTIVLAGVRQLADLLVELVDRLVGGEVIGFQAEERFDESVDFLGRVLGAASEILVGAGGLLGGGGALAIGAHGIIRGLRLFLDLVGRFLVGLGLLVDFGREVVGHGAAPRHLGGVAPSGLDVLLERVLDLLHGGAVAHGAAGHVGEVDAHLLHGLGRVLTADFQILEMAGDGLGDVAAGLDARLELVLRLLGLLLSAGECGKRGTGDSQSDAPRAAEECDDAGESSA